nr:MFS transporter [Salmonella enterica]KHP23782.1 glucuronide transporter [Salmonella enterica subsp. enterica serovar Brandenburg]
MNQPLSWRVIVGYSLGDVANNFAFAMGALFLLSYYTDVAGVGAAAAGTMLLLVRIFDAFADVVAGRIVDSVNTRWGKFRPFLLFGSAPLMLFSVLVFCVPAEWSHSNKVIYAYLTYMGLGFCYSMVNIPYGSLATAMTQEPRSRARLGAARSIAASLRFLISTFAVSASSLFYVRYVLNDTALFSVIVLVQMLVGSVASAPLVPRLVAKIGKKNTFLAGALMGTLGYLLFFYMSDHSVPVALTALAIAAIGQGITMTVMWALEADTVEYGEYLTGVRIEGLTYSLFSFTRKCGQAIGGSIPAFILGLSGYIANQTQTPEVITGIRMSISLIPCGFMLLAFIIIWFYPLTDNKFKEIVQEIDKRKQSQQQLIKDFNK